MPFISDMGLNAHVLKVFLMGTMVEGLLISSWLLWATLARSHILKLLRLRFVALVSLCVCSVVPVSLWAPSSSEYSLGMSTPTCTLHVRVAYFGGFHSSELTWLRGWRMAPSSEDHEIHEPNRW